MSKITYEKAKELINSGYTVLAKASREEFPVSTLNALDNLQRLKNLKVQNYELFYQPSKIPENALNASLDEAIELLDSGETINSLHDGKELTFSSAKKLIEYYRSCMKHEGSCTLYFIVQ